MSDRRANAAEVADGSAAVATLRAAAQAGDVAAQTLYAQIHAEGRGVATDFAESLHWYQLAGNSGDAMAMNMVGRCHELGLGTPQCWERAAAWYRKAAASGLDWGQYNYANLLRRGLGVKRDRDRAFELYRRAAAQGHAKSMNLIGRYHDEGWGVARDPEAAALWYRRAAAGGDFRGQTSHASLLAGCGEIDAAIAWLQRAARTATAAFLEQLAADIERSPVAGLRAVAAELRAAAMRRG